MALVAERTPGLHGELGVGGLTPDLSESLQRYLEHPNAPQLFQELLFDAQTAWFAGNLRRSVLELAVACEIVVTRHFFADESPAGAAFDYLEDQGRIRVRVLDLMTVFLRRGHRSRSERPDEYRDLDHLFRCRNKVAHRGELSYQDDGGPECMLILRCCEMVEFDPGLGGVARRPAEDGFGSRLTFDWTRWARRPRVTKR